MKELSKDQENLIEAFKEYLTKTSHTDTVC